MQQNLPKTAQNYPKLPKDKLWNTTKNRDFSVFQNLKISMCRGETIAYFHLSDFQSKNVLYAILIVKNWPLCMWISAYPLGNWWFSQASTPCVGMRFCEHVPNSPRNKNLKKHISYLLEKVVFLDPKRLLSPFGMGKKTFSSTLNVMILQMVRNETVRFGRHIDIEVSYKILQ
jgi:hypothetical protein